MKIVVIGANAAGAKAASKANRINPKADVTLIDRRSFISYGACGIPYYVSDTVADVKVKGFDRIFHVNDGRITKES